MASRKTHQSTYQPKFCRTRDCNQPFGHDGRCSGAHREPLTVKVVPTSTRQQRRAQTRAMQRALAKGKTVTVKRGQP